MLGSVSSQHQPGLSLYDLRTQQKSTSPATRRPSSQPPKQASLDIQDSAQFTSRQGKVPARQVKLFDDSDTQENTAPRFQQRPRNQHQLKQAQQYGRNQLVSQRSQRPAVGHAVGFNMTA